MPACKTLALGRLAVLGAYLSGVVALEAADYHVIQDHPQAADSNPGTKEQPFRTISAAAKIVRPGDTVIVAPGLYRESVTLTVSGEPGKPIVFRSEVPRKAVISGSDIVTAWTKAAPRVWMATVPPRRINKWAALPGHSGVWVYVNEVPLQYSEDVNSMTPGSFLIDVEGGRLYVSLEEGQAIEKVKVEYANRSGLICSMASLSDIHIIGFTLKHNADWARGASALFVQEGRRWRIEGNHICWSSYWGLKTDKSNEMVIRDNLVEWCGDSGVGGSHVLNMLFEGNTVRYNNWRRFRTNGEGGGSKWVVSMDSLVKGNDFNCNYGPSIWFDWGNCNVVFDSNVTHHNTQGAGLFPEFCFDMILRGNVSYNNGGGILIAQNGGTLVKRNIVFNNGSGLYVRGDGRPKEKRYPDMSTFQNTCKVMRAVPGADPKAIDRWEAGYLRHIIAPRSLVAVSSVFWENLVFDNEENYTERRVYGKMSPTDPEINNYSDFNIWYSKEPLKMFLNGEGYYEGGLDGWRKASGRDENSIVLNPREPGAKLPDWVEEKRGLWDIRLLSFDEIRKLKLGLVDSPMGCAASMRISLSPYCRQITLKDSSIKAYVFEVDGEKTLGLWSTSPGERRYVRLKLGQDRIIVENGYLQKQELSLSGQYVDVTVTFVPTYLRGVGEPIIEMPTSNLGVEPFNLSGAAIPAKATFVNGGPSPCVLTAEFSASKGFVPEPMRVTENIPAGKEKEFDVKLIPDGTVLKGCGKLAVAATMGAQTLERMTSFSFGESAGTVPMKPGNIHIDGKLDDWGTLVSRRPPIGLVSGREDFANGTVGLWKGSDDLSGKIYAAWDPKALYVAVVVNDQKVVPARDGSDPWTVDCVEVFIDGRSFDMQFQQEPTEGCYQIGVSPSLGEGRPNTKVFQKTLSLMTASSLTDKGYIVEMAVPFSNENFPAGDWKAGRAIRLSVLMNDKDDPDSPERKYTLGWAFSPGGANCGDTTGWKLLKLQQESE
jgi:hypothetical protein